MEAQRIDEEGTFAVRQLLLLAVGVELDKWSPAL